MIINSAENIDFNGTELTEFGDYSVVDFTTDISSTNDEEGNILITKGAKADRWNYHGYSYTSPLKFKFTIANNTGSFISQEEERAFKKWLCIDRFAWLHFYQDDMEEIYYYCKITFSSVRNVSRNTAGIEFLVTCDSPYAWSEEVVKKITTKDNTATASISGVCDFDEYRTATYLKIKANSTCDVVITNTTDDDTEVEIEDCIKDEEIIIDGINQRISSNKRTSIAAKWNKNFFELLSKRNSITITGDCYIEVKFRSPIRVGG